MKIVTYGSLRKGNYNYERFKALYQNDFNYIETVKIKGYDLYNLGAYPGIKLSKDRDKELIVDIIECSDNCFNSINRMELGAGYIGRGIYIEDNHHIIYLYDYEVNQEDFIESGDWNKYLEEVENSASCQC